MTNQVDKKFLTAGDAIFTVELPTIWANKLGKPHLTYRITKVDKSENWPESWFAKLLIGPDNLSDYVYLGKLDPNTAQVMITRKSRRAESDWEVKILKRTLARIWADELEAIEETGFKVHHEGRCGRCARVLTVPESIVTGIGPECALKMGLGERAAKRVSKEEQLSLAEEI